MLLVYCDQTTAGGGWTLVYSYTFSDYQHYEEKTNFLIPKPNWMTWVDRKPSTTPPKRYLWFIYLQHVGEEVTVHNTSTSLEVCEFFYVPMIERRETRPMDERPCPRTVWWKKVVQRSTLDQAGDWTRDLLVGSQRSYQLCQPGK